MKILHTADWHIGQLFFGYNRKNEHSIFLDWLKNKLTEHNVDVMLVSGDIFDSPNPSAESQKLYFKFLREVTNNNPNLQIVITAGNHDSAARLEAPNPLLEEINITIKGVIKRNTDNSINYNDLLVPLKENGEIKAWCMAVPFLRQGDYPPSENYKKGVSAMYAALYGELMKLRQPEQAIIAMGHLQASGAEVSENDRSERTIKGGLDAISSDIFDKKDILYTALGHLHKAQSVSLYDNVWYSGSPLPMSFTEKNYIQGVNLIEITGNKLNNIERILFTPPVRLISIPHEALPLSDVLEEIKKLPEGEINQESPYVELKILIKEPEPSVRNFIEEALQNKSVRLTRLIPFIPKTEKKDKKTILYGEAEQLNPLDIAEDIFIKKYGDKMPEKLRELFKSVMREIEI